MRNVLLGSVNKRKSLSKKVAMSGEGKGEVEMHRLLTVPLY